MNNKYGSLRSAIYGVVEVTSVFMLGLIINKFIKWVSDIQQEKKLGSAGDEREKKLSDAGDEQERKLSGAGDEQEKKLGSAGDELEKPGSKTKELGFEIKQRADEYNAEKAGSPVDTAFEWQFSKSGDHKKAGKHPETGDHTESSPILASASISQLSSSVKNAI